ncbi:hypothetical protein Pmani_023438 [Petrolisthes manimaculis]|uniref:Uncharacterized protein n=1 Tax=Petrolisthes manimaculis TaxID=1843537 RepID=A0AAE1PBU1_9EUCA|nr:hypothetical protein Pmani_023438 [Petrolisthes manimaculis]
MDVRQVTMSSKVKFQDAWLQKPEFQPWLAREEGNPKRAYCKICKAGIGAEISTIRRHKKAKMHVTNEGKANEHETDESGPSTSRPNNSPSGMFYRSDVISKMPLEDIDPRDERNYVPVHQVWLGSSMQSLFQRSDIRQRVDMVNDITYGTM